MEQWEDWGTSLQWFLFLYQDFGLTGICWALEITAGKTSRKIHIRSYNPSIKVPISLSKWTKDWSETSLLQWVRAILQLPDKTYLWLHFCHGLHCSFPSRPLYSKISYLLSCQKSETQFFSKTWVTQAGLLWVLFSNLLKPQNSVSRGHWQSMSCDIDWLRLVTALSCLVARPE